MPMRLNRRPFSSSCLQQPSERTWSSSDMRGIALGNLLDDTDGDGLSHVTHGKTSEKGVVRESLDAHSLLGYHLNDSSISRLDLLRVVLKFLSRTTINLLLQFSEFASDVSGMAIDDGCVAGTDLSRVVQDDDLQIKEKSFIRIFVRNHTSLHAYTVYYSHNSSVTYTQILSITYND